MGIGDVRYTVLQIVNEVQRKLSLNQTSTLIANKLATELVDHINDVVDELSDYGNWQEVLTSANIPISAGIANYSVNTSAVIKNIGDIYYTGKTGPLRQITIEEYRLRPSANGTPSQFSIYGTDANGNPNIRITPIPTSAMEVNALSVLYYTKPARYTTSDDSAIVPYPARVVVQGTLAHYLLNESDGAPTDKYTAALNLYVAMRKEALNRFNSDTGWSLSFTPSNRTRRRR